MNSPSVCHGEQRYPELVPGTGTWNQFRVPLGGCNEVLGSDPFCIAIENAPQELPLENLPAFRAVRRELEVDAAYGMAAAEASRSEGRSNRHSILRPERSRRTARKGRAVL